MKRKATPHTYADVMAQLKAAGSAQTRKTYARHGVEGEMFGVSYATLKAMDKKVADDTELAARIRAGELDDCYSDVAAAIRERVWDKLSIMNPRYATPYTSADSREE